MDVGAVREQHFDDVGVFLRHGPHERRLAARRARVRVGAPGKELFDDLRVSRSGGGHQGRFAEEERQVGIRSGLVHTRALFQERAQGLPVRVLRGVDERNSRARGHSDRREHDPHRDEYCQAPSFQALRPSRQRHGWIL
jgi:hypothetical protein